VNPVRHVEPSCPHGPLYRAFARFTASRLGFWLSRTIGWRVEAERARLWALADNVFPPFESYRREAGVAGRTIPILQLIDRGEAP
jgi:hypothetical protein